MTFSERTPVEGRYLGDGYSLFWLALMTSALTLITLGLYRFWAKTRIRRFIWSSISLGGDRFEYTGTGLEKFLGFLVAIAILALYLAVIQTILFFFGLNIMAEPETFEAALAQITAFYLTALAVVPLWFFAVYRARRYKLARTKWRGIRFGMEKGGIGYAWRALVYWALTISTLGILLPLQTYRLEKYMTDRSYYGTANFQQEGRWTDLYGALKHLLIGIGIFILGTVVISMEARVFGVFFSIVGYLWGIAGLVYYRVAAFRYLTGTKVLDGTVTFTSDVRTGRVIGILIFGSLGIAVVAAILLGFATVLFAYVTEAAFQMGTGLSVFVLPILSYFAALLLTGALTLALIVQPLVRHAVETLTVPEPGGLDAIRQRTFDRGADAEGFADALDVGGAI